MSDMMGRIFKNRQRSETASPRFSGGSVDPEFASGMAQAFGSEGSGYREPVTGSASGRVASGSANVRGYEEPLTQWAWSKGMSPSGYRAGSDPDMERLLALQMGWGGQEDLGEFFSNVLSSGRRFGTQWEGMIPAVEMQRLFQEAGIEF